MAKDRFGFGTSRLSDKSNNNVEIFTKALEEVGIDPSTSQADLWKIYAEAEKTNNTAVTSTLDKYYDWWN